MFRERKVGPIINKSKQKSIISGTQLRPTGKVTHYQNQGHEYDVETLKSSIIPFLIRAFSLLHQTGSMQIYTRRHCATTCESNYLTPEGLITYLKSPIAPSNKTFLIDNDMYNEWTRNLCSYQIRYTYDYICI